MELLRTSLMGAGEMAQRLRALVALPEDTGLKPRTHMVLTVCNPRSKGSHILLLPPHYCTQVIHRHTRRRNTLIHKINNRKRTHVLRVKNTSRSSDPGSVPSTHIRWLTTTCNSSFRESYESVIVCFLSLLYLK